MTWNEIVQMANVRNASRDTIVYTKDEIREFFKMIREGNPFFYGMTDVWLWDALDKYNIYGDSTAIMGSITAWYETNAIARGAFPTTIEYNPRISEYEKIKILKPSELNGEVFDSAFSISSFEHDGLGYYGEPKDDNADLKSMRRMKDIVKKGGLLFLAVPIGRDNMHDATRIYGKERFPLLIQGWEILESFGMDFCGDKELWDTDGQVQPVFVLQNV